MHLESIKCKRNYPGENSVTNYLTQLKTVWDEYYSMLALSSCSCGTGTKFVSILETQQIMQFLMRLNDIYKTARGSILMINPLPTLNQAYRLILQEERQREFHYVSVLSPDSAGFAVHSQYHKGLGNIENGYQGYKGNSSRTSDGNGQHVTYGIAPNGKKSKYFCSECKIYGRSIERCFKVHGFSNAPKGNFKGKRMASNAMGDSFDQASDDTPSGDGSSTSANSIPAINQQQYEELMSLLNQHKVNTQGGSHSFSSGFVAGFLSEGASGAW